MNFILASKSPRRVELLKKVIPDFEVIVSNENENLLDDDVEISEKIVEVAFKKAENVYNRTSGNRFVIGADTVVFKNGKIYGKPKDEDEARCMLKELLLGDGVHEVVTGLAVILLDGQNKKVFKTFDVTKVYLKDMDDKDIFWWLDKGKALDKAGAYAIQEEFGVFIDKIEGNYSTVVGLPIHKVYEIYKKCFK